MPLDTWFAEGLRRVSAPQNSLWSVKAIRDCRIAGCIITIHVYDYATLLWVVGCGGLLSLMGAGLPADHRSTVTPPRPAARVVHIQAGHEHPPSTQRLSRLESIGAQIARRRVVEVASRLGLQAVYRRFSRGLVAVWLRFASRSHTAYCAMSTSPRTT